ncbi:MAG: SCO family protein [Ignavibacteriaceae bacterium]|nr:SCO family protein [Ignavibacteriaceae bacterium]NUM71208.1 SCO family protein [Ignavibacteriaceae bacterium]
MFRINVLRLGFVVLAAVLLSGIVFASDVKENKKNDAGIDDTKLGNTLSGEYKLTDEKGNTVKLADVVDKTTILMFVYYQCPGLCSPLMTEVASAISRVDMFPGKDYKIVSVSIDPAEDYKIAADKQKQFTQAANIEFPEGSWRFMTADSVTIAKLTDEAGFYYTVIGEKQISHPGLLIFLSPERKITRYLLGTRILPFDLKMALIEASEGKIGPTIAKVLKFCFSYDPQGKTYMLNVTRISGVIIIALSIVLVVVLVTKKNKKNLNEGV